MKGIKMAEKLSVIIPVYRTEKYLKKCIDSVLSQDYSDLELILVDDGSDDGCPAICDEYARLDKRVSVIHKKNGGLSSARNAGLDAAMGEYVTFVDSDDFIEKDMYSYMMSEKGDSNIVCCSHFVVEGGEKRQATSFSEKVVFNSDKAVHELLKDQKLKNYVWNKVFSRELFNSIRFPEGMNFEDIPVTAELFRKADSVCILPDAKYNYVMRSDGISKTESVKNLCDRFKAHKMRYERLVNLYPEENGEMQKHMMYAARLLALGLIKQWSESAYNEAFNCCFSYYRDNIDNVIKLECFNKFEKKQIRLLAAANKKDFIKLRNVDYLRKADKLIHR